MVLLFLVVSVAVEAQEEKVTTANSENFKGLYVGATISTNGWGGEVKYQFNKRFTIKSGFEDLKVDYNFSIEESDVDYEATVNFNSGGIYLFGDFNFTRNLYISTGALFNKFNPDVTGSAVSGIQYGDIVIPPEMVGHFAITVDPGLAVSPYASLGVRSFFGKQKRVVLNTEIGCYYMGPPDIEIEATGLIAPTADPAHGQEEMLESQIEQYQFYPVLKFTLAVKLF